MQKTWVLNLKTSGLPGISRNLGFRRTNPEPQLCFVRESTGNKIETYVATFGVLERIIPQNPILIPRRFETIRTNSTVRYGTVLYRTFSEHLTFFQTQGLSWESPILGYPGNKPICISVYRGFKSLGIFVITNRIKIPWYKGYINIDLPGEKKTIDGEQWVPYRTVQCPHWMNVWAGDY